MNVMREELKDKIAKLKEEQLDIKYKLSCMFWETTPNTENIVELEDELQVVEYALWYNQGRSRVFFEIEKHPNELGEFKQQFINIANDDNSEQGYQWLNPYSRGVLSCIKDLEKIGINF